MMCLILICYRLGEGNIDKLFRKNVLGGIIIAELIKKDIKYYAVKSGSKT